MSRFTVIFCLVFLLLHCPIAVADEQANGKEQQKPPEHCAEAEEWPLNGRALVRDYKGRVLLLTFVSLKKCDPECQLALSRLDSLHDQIASVRVLAIAPADEPAFEVRAFAWRYPRIRFEHEHKVSPVWSWFRAAHLDQFIFDRCSRQSSNLSASSNPPAAPPYSSTASELRAALSEQPCGPCEYDFAKSPPKWPSLHPPVPMKIPHSKMQFPKPIISPQVIVVNHGGLLNAFSREIGSHKENGQKQLAFVEQNRAVGSNHKNYQQRSTTPNQQQQQQEQQQPSQPQPHSGSSAAVHANQPQWQQQQQQQIQMQLQQQREELARLQQQQAERERLLREHEERLRQRQQMEEQQRQYWAQRQRAEQEQQQHFSQNVAPPQHPQQQNQRPVQQIAPPPERQPTSNQQSSPVQYANDPYGDRYRFGLVGQSRTAEQVSRQVQRQQQRPIQRQSMAIEQQQPRGDSHVQNPANQPIAPFQQQWQHQQQMLPQQPAVAAQAEGPIEPAPLYPEGSENDYYGYDDWTTEMPSMSQIPKPTKPVVPTTPSIQQDKNFGFELPCTGFSDESCFQQQTQLRPNEVHRCCRGRILFTDQCVTGKCTNMTTQLCCIQRFLQAKLTCCSDERQAETTIGDHFSHCCFDNFVDSDDPCCPRDYAAEQWRSVHELCLPNVDMDLSEVKVPVPLMGTSLITEFDFGKTDKWRFDCRYGGHVQQYSYFEQSSEELENEGGGTEMNE